MTQRDLNEYIAARHRWQELMPEDTEGLHNLPVVDLTDEKWYIDDDGVWYHVDERVAGDIYHAGELTLVADTSEADEHQALYVFSNKNQIESPN